MRYDLLIRGGEVIDPAGDRYGAYDVAVAGGTIAAIVVDAGATIIPAQGPLLKDGPRG
jgi:predicted amidohydrolase